MLVLLLLGDLCMLALLLLRGSLLPRLQRAR